MPDFPIIDTHVHLFDPSGLPYAWLSGAPPINKPHLPADFDRLTAPVTIEGMVFVEVDVDDPRYLDEAEWVEKLARSDQRIRGMVAGMPLERGVAIESDIAKYAKLPHARGVRRLIQKHAGEPGWCLRPDFVAAVKLLPRYNLTFDLCIFHPQLADTIELVRRCPEVGFILDHIGKPGIKDGITQPWRSEMRELAELPNVICKISGVVTEADHKSWTYDQVAPYIAHAIETFGFDRVAFGGDWPVSELAVRYADWVGIVDRVIAGASDAEKRKLYRDNAIRFYRL
ncbi:MAG TPA: amidohydrolase family protein [Bauldia sp.]|nr:amidohydrolase family protein [Bauldia sp.]